MVRDSPAPGDLVRLERFGYACVPVWVRADVVRPAVWARGWLYVEGIAMAADGTPCRQVAMLTPADQVTVYQGRW